ncbi:MAG: hypothetical protein AB8B60_05070 [Sulfitobacter sp.]
MFLPQTVKDTFPENWPDEVSALSWPGAQIVLSPEDTQMLSSFNGFVSRNCAPSQVTTFSDAFYADIETAVAKYPAGVMPRLGYCSWKGATLVHRPARHLADVMQIITQNDDRIGHALACAVIAGEGVTLHLREWQNIAPDQEFRTFLRAGQIAGVSQYRYKSRYDAVVRHHAAINHAIAAFLPELMDVLHLDPVVADLWVNWTDSPTQPLVKLIELNPFDPATDPCLFSWQDGGDFDGTFRTA